MVEVESKSLHTYDGQKRPIGTRYIAAEKFIPVLKKLGWAEPVVSVSALPINGTDHQRLKVKKVKPGKRAK